MSNASDLGILLQIEARALDAPTLEALRFTIVNETHALAPYRQAALFELDGERFRLAAASGLVSVTNDSPFAVWLTQFAQRFPRDGATHRLDFENAAEQDAEHWEEWLPDHLLLVPIRAATGGVQGMVMYARETEWTEDEVEAVLRLHTTYSYCHAALGRSRHQSCFSARRLFK